MKKTGLLLVCCALLFLSACGGQTKGEEEALKASEEFIGFIRPFYEGERENYTFLDARNQDQTDAIYQDTMEWAKEEEWDKIHSHVFEQAEVLRRYGTLTEGEGRRDQVVTVAAQVQDEEDPEEIREVYWDMCGTIWYNASGMVTSCEGKNSNLTVLPQDGTTYQMAKSVFDWQIASSQRSATFGSTVQIAAQSPDGPSYTATYESVSDEMEVYAPEVG